MKKFVNYFYAALFMVLATVSLTSCSNDDEPDGGSIIGTWQNVGELANAMGVTQYIQFNEGGIFYEVDVYPASLGGDVDVDKGTWSLSGNTLKIDGHTSTLKSVSSSKLVIETMGISQEYKKVSDSVIDKYL